MSHRGSGRIAAGYARLQTASVENERLNELLQRQSVLERSRAALEAEIERVRSELAAQERVLAHEVERLQTAAGRECALSAARADLDTRSEALGQEEQRLCALKTERQSLRDSVAALRSQNERLRADMEAIKLKQKELSDATVCPLCRTDLGEDGHQHIIDSYEQEGRSLAAQFREKRSQAQEAEKQADGIDAEVTTLELRIARERECLARDSGSLESALQEAVAAVAVLPERAAALEKIQQSLAIGGFACEPSERLREVADELSSIGYDQVEHQRTRAAVLELRPYEARQRALETAAVRLESERAALAELQQAQCDWRGRIEQCCAELEQIRQTLSDEPDTSERLAHLEARSENALREQRNMQQAVGAIEQKLDDCSRLRCQLESEVSRPEEGARGTRYLRGAGRGIQPSGNSGADHRLRAARDYRGGQPPARENDQQPAAGDDGHAASDAEGQRFRNARDSDRGRARDPKYELFSGGEAFRVNLALRIALSKLLARRAGAPLPTLVIDEGFGSQDAAALERLVEAINVIQSDFQCLLIITHLNELKDQFPVQIAVTKTAEGSLATVTS